MKKQRKGELFSREFMAGQRACINGDPCPKGASSSFVRGYNTQYTLDQMNSQVGAGNVHN